MTRRLLGRAIRARFDNVTNLAVLGLGYATPYLGVFREEAERCIAVMPAAQGVVRWPSSGPTLATLADETMLPLPTASIDRVVAVHALEMTDNAAEMLREVWRVLAPGGRLLAVVPNRRGVWARLDTTPFGNGRPFSRGQVVNLLREALFTPVGRGALRPAERLVPAYGGGLRAGRRAALPALLRGAGGGGDQAALSPGGGAPLASGSGARTGPGTGARRHPGGIGQPTRGGTLPRICSRSKACPRAASGSGRWGCRQHPRRACQGRPAPGSANDRSSCR